MKTNTSKYITYGFVFIFLFVVFLVGELVFKLIFYPEYPYWKSLVFVALAALMMVFIGTKTGELNHVRDIVKYKKKKIKIKLAQQSIYLIKETLKLNGYIINENKTTEHKIYFSSKFNFLDFGDVFSLDFLTDTVLLKARPKAFFNITDPNRITAKRVNQIEQIITHINQNTNIK